jgi:hypothetical protein
LRPGLRWGWRVGLAAGAALGAFQLGVAAQPELNRGRLGVEVHGLGDAVLLVQVAEERLGAVDDLVVGVGEHGWPPASNVCSSIPAASIPLADEITNLDNKYCRH